MGTLSNNIKAPKLLKAIDIVPDESMNLGPLIEAHMPGTIGLKFNEIYQVLRK